MNGQSLGVLATCGDPYPHSSLVGFAATEDLKHIVFATIRDTRKFKNIQKNANVSILIDSHTNQAADFKDAVALTVLGNATETLNTERESFLSIYLKKHPYLKEFVLTPNCALVKIAVHKYIVVSNFQNVQNLDME